MRLRSTRFFHLLAGLFVGAGLCGAAAAADDAGVVNLLAGEVQFQAPGTAPARVEPFMKVRVGDTLRAGPGARVRIVYFASGRQELWTGPAGFRVGTRQGEALSGEAQVSALPVAVSRRLEHSAHLIAIAREGRAGSVQVRSAGPDLAAARKTYAALREGAEADDITPELYLFAVLESARAFGEMADLLRAMKAKQPDNPRLAELERWLATVPR